MKTGILIGIGIILFIILCIALAFITGLIDILYSKIIGVQKQNVETEIFNHTKAYIEGKTQELIKYKFEYDMANESDRKIIVNTIRHSFADFNEDLLQSEELKIFLKEIKY